MHILLTDRLTCPRCGPEFGLILLAEHIQDRRILEGEMGCPNCRERFTVRDGLGDLRWPGEADGASPESASDESTKLAPVDRDSAMRVAALLGITGGPGHVLLAGETGRYAPLLAGLVEGIEWVTTGACGAEMPESAGVSRVLAHGGTLPFFSGMFRGVVTAGDTDDLTEAIRLLDRTAALVVLRPLDTTKRAVVAGGFEVVLDDPSALVARPPGTGGSVA